MKKIICAVVAILSIMCISLVAAAASNVYCTSAEGVISLHISPDESSFKIADIPACSKVRLIKSERTWGLVECNNKCGWINLSFTRDSYEEAAKATGVDSSGNVCVKTKDKKAPLYNVPSTVKSLGSEEKYVVPNGMILKIMREMPSGWALVSMNDKYAWVELKNVEKYETQAEKSAAIGNIYYVYVLSDGGKGLELLENAGSGNLYAVIPDCIKLTVREKKNDYGYVSYDGINGWIDLRQTAPSLSEAQSKSGEAVNAEYEVVPQNGEEEVQLLSVPSEKLSDGGFSVGAVGANEAVFVLRTTLGGWSLINFEGSLGWIAPGNLKIAENTENEIIKLLDKEKKGYVATQMLEGIKVYPTYDSEEKIATIPECTYVKVVAEKNGLYYVTSDYAAGWARDVELVDSEKEALSLHNLKRKGYYTIKKETYLMSKPAYSELCGSEQVIILNKGDSFEVTKIVTTGKRKWGLAEKDGKIGWVNLNCTKEANPPIIKLLLIVLATVLLLAVTTYIIMKRKGRRV